MICIKYGKDERMNNPPLLYKKIYERLLKKSKTFVIKPVQFRIILCEFGVSQKEGEWLAIANDLKKYGFFNHVTRRKIVICDDNKNKERLEKLGQNHIWH